MGRIRYFGDYSTTSTSQTTSDRSVGHSPPASSFLLLQALSPEAAIVGFASLGTGYGFTQLALYNMLPIGVLLLLPFAKILTTSLTIGSGGSGGVFAPGLVIGGSAGGALGALLHLALPGIVLSNRCPSSLSSG